MKSRVLTSTLVVVLARQHRLGLVHQRGSAGAGSSYPADPGWRHDKYPSVGEGADGLQQPELRPGAAEADGAGSINRPRPGFKNGKFPKKPLDAPTVPSSVVAGSNPELALSFDGMNHRQQRLANGGNQFSLEPPDQGLCVGNGYVVEVINSVIRVWNTSGGALNGRAGPEYVLRIPRRHRPSDIPGAQLHRPERDRPAMLLRPGQQPVRRRHHDAVR